MICLAHNIGQVYNAYKRLRAVCWLGRKFTISVPEQLLVMVRSKALIGSQVLVSLIFPRVS